MSENKTASGGGAGSMTVSPTGPDARTRPALTYSSGFDLLNQLTGEKFMGQSKTPRSTGGGMLAQPGITPVAPPLTPEGYIDANAMARQQSGMIVNPAEVQARSDQLFGPTGQMGAPRLARLRGPAAGQPGSVMRGPGRGVDPVAASQQQWRNPFAGGM